MYKTYGTIYALTALLLLLPIRQAGAFDITYRYELADGNATKVCRHMLSVYNKRFSRPWDHKSLPEESLRNGDWKTIYSREPSSPEYEAIKWRTHHYDWNGSAQPVLYAEFDIDNDGVDELILKTAFFYGSPGSWDYLEIYPSKSVDFTKFKTRADYQETVAPHRLALIGFPIHQRPFVVAGTTYLSGYVYTPREGRGANPAEPFTPPEYLLIRRYVGGRAKDAAEQEKFGSMKPVCKFNMIQLIAK